MIVAVLSILAAVLGLVYVVLVYLHPDLLRRLAQSLHAQAGGKKFDVPSSPLTPGYGVGGQSYPHDSNVVRRRGTADSAAASRPYPDHMSFMAARAPPGLQMYAARPPPAPYGGPPPMFSPTAAAGAAPGPRQPPPPHQQHQLQQHQHQQPGPPPPPNPHPQPPVAAAIPPPPAPAPPAPIPRAGTLKPGKTAAFAFGRSQFVQVFHDEPLVSRRPSLKPSPAIAPAGGTPAGVPNTHGDSLAADAAAGGRRHEAPQPPKVSPAVAVAPRAVEPRVPKGDFEINFSSLSLGELIGQGAFGKVYKARWRGTHVAVKMLVCQHMTAEVIDEFRREVAVLSALRHPNIVLFMGAVTVPPNYSLVTELVSRGSLWSVLHGPSVLDWPTVLKMAQDTARGMAFLHSASPAILHRDLKSGNLLVDESGRTKLTDFGLARLKAYTMTMTGSCGTFQWMAPEVLGNQRYTEKADVFSFAVVCWELVTRKCPFESMNQIQMAMGVLNHGMRETIPPTTHAKYADLIRRCWDATPSKRPSFIEILDVLEAIEA